MKQSPRTQTPLAVIASRRSRAAVRLRPFFYVLWLILTGFEWSGRRERLLRELRETPPVARQLEIVRSLSRYRADEVSDAIVFALSLPEASVRLEAARVAGTLRIPAASAALRGWLGESDAELRLAAADALSRIGDAQAAQELIRVLGDQDPAVRAAAIQALALVPSEASLVALISRLEDPDPTVRSAAVRALTATRDSRVLVPLLSRARDEDENVRAVILEHLGAFADARAVSVLAMATRDGAEAPRLAAIAALGHVDDTRSVEVLARVADDGDARSAAAAVVALGGLSVAEAGDELISLLRVTRVRSLAVTALAQSRALSTERLIRELSTADGEIIRPLADVLLQRLRDRPEDAGAVAPLLGSVVETVDYPDARAVLLRCLGFVGGDAALLTLLAATANPGDRVIAIEALKDFSQRFGLDGRAADPLLNLVPNVPAALREDVIRLLGQTRAERVLPFLRETMEQEGDETARVAAIEALGQVDSSASVEVLLPLLDSSDVRLRFHAANAIGATADGAAVATLLQSLMRDAPTDRVARARAITLALRRGIELAPAHEALLAQVSERIFASRSDKLHHAFLEVLAASRSAGSVATLLELSRSSAPLGRAALRALVLAKPDVALQVAREHAQGVDIAARVNAFLVYAAVGGAEELSTLQEAISHSGYPVSPAASYAVLRITGRLTDRSQIAAFVCDFLSLRENALRTNILLTLAASGATCSVPAEQFLHPSMSNWVSTAAAQWLRALGRESVLTSCRTSHPDDDVRDACARSVVTEPHLLDVYLRGDNGDLAPGRMVAFRFADGSVMLTETDANGHVVWPDVPGGPHETADLLSIPLEAR